MYRQKYGGVNQAVASRSVDKGGRVVGQVGGCAEHFCNASPPQRVFTGRYVAKAAWEGMREAEGQPISWAEPTIWP